MVGIYLRKIIGNVYIGSKAVSYFFRSRSERVVAEPYHLYM